MKTSVSAATHWLVRDPRHYQIAVLTGLLVYGLFWLDFEITLPRAALILVSSLSVQWVCTVIWRLPQFDPRSALISGLSLCLLLRTNSVALTLFVAAITIASKFLFQWKRKLAPDAQQPRQH